LSTGMVPHGVILCSACVCVFVCGCGYHKNSSLFLSPAAPYSSGHPSLYPSLSLSRALCLSLARALSLSVLSVCGVCVPQIGRFAVARAREVSRLCCTCARSEGAVRGEEMMERRLGEEVGRNRRGGEAPWGRERVGVGVDSGSVCVLVLDRARMRLPYCTRQYTGSPNENQAKPRPCEALPRRSCSRHRSIVAAAGRPFTNTAPSRGLGEDCRSLFYFAAFYSMN